MSDDAKCKHRITIQEIHVPGRVHLAVTVSTTARATRDGLEHRIRNRKDILFLIPSMEYDRGVHYIKAVLHPGVNADPAIVATAIKNMIVRRRGWKPDKFEYVYTPASGSASS